MSAAPVSTRTDLAALDRIIDAQKDVVELESDLLEDDEETRGATQAFRRDAMPSAMGAAAPMNVPVPIQSPFPAPVQTHGHVMPVHATPKPQTVIPDPRKIVAQQKEMARQQELAHQAEIARQHEAARQAEIARQQETLRAQEYARQQEAARQAEIARQHEMARQEQIARDFERQEQELTQQRIERDKQELARQQQELARQKEELARHQEIARQQDLSRQQALARQAEELDRAKQAAAKAEAAKLAAEIDAAEKLAVVTPRDADPMSVSQMKAATLNAPPVMSRAPETPAMPTPQLPVEDLSATVQGVPAPLIPDAPQTSPVLDGHAAEDRTLQKPTARTLQSAQQSPVKISEAANAEEAKHFTQPFRRPSSIAPVAIDILPARTGTQQSPAATMPIQRMDARRADAELSRLTRMPPKENHTPWIIAACVAGVFLLGGGITAAFALVASSSASAAAAAADDDGDGQRNARTPESTGAKSAPPVAPSIGSHGDKVPAPASEPVSVNSLPAAAGPAAKKHDSSGSSAPSAASTGTSHGSSSSASTPNSKVLVPASPAAAPSPAPAPSSPAPSPSVASNTAPAAAPAAPKAAAAPGGNGVIQVKPPLVVIVVDGQHKRAVNGEVVVSCGQHKVRAGMDTQVVNVPCGGSVAL